MPTRRGQRVLLEQRQQLEPFVLKLVVLLEVPMAIFVVVLLTATKAPWHVTGFVLGAMAIGPVLVATARLVVKVQEDRLRMGFPPYWSSSISYDAIESVEVVQVSAMRDFMGWGPKVVAGATGYIAKSGGAVRITRLGKKRTLVLTSDDPEALASAIMEQVVARGEQKLAV